MISHQMTFDNLDDMRKATRWVMGNLSIKDVNGSVYAKYIMFATLADLDQALTERMLHELRHVSYTVQEREDYY